MREMEKKGLETLDVLIREVARTRAVLTKLVGAEAEEVDKQINDMCTEHFNHFNGMSKSELIKDMLKFSMTVNPEATFEALFGEVD